MCPSSSTGLDVLRKTTREFAEEVLKPAARRIDEEDWVPDDIRRRMAEMGYFALRVPEKYGGPGLSVKETAVVVEELGRGSSGASLISVVSGSMFVYPLLHFASEELRERYFTRLAKGSIAAFALTEPCCGTDAANLQTRAVAEGDEYIISGTKTFITASQYADFFVVAARTGRPEDRHRGVSLFVVDKNPCIQLSKYHMMGYRGAGTSEVKFNECRVPKENMVGELNKGFKYTMMTLNEGRIITASSTLGVMQAAFEEAFEYAKQRTSMGAPLIEHQMVQSMIARINTLVEASRCLLYKAADLADAGDPEHVRFASIAKYFTASSAVDVARLAMQVQGGYGYSKDSVVERLYRDVKMVEIGDGTNEVQQMVIVKYLLGKISLKV